MLLGSAGATSRNKSRLAIVSCKELSLGGQGSLGELPAVALVGTPADLRGANERTGQRQGEFARVVAEQSAIVSDSGVVLVE